MEQAGLLGDSAMLLAFMPRLKAAFERLQRAMMAL